MLEVIAVFLVSYQLLMFVYFVTLNGSYTLFTLIAFTRIHRYAATDSEVGLAEIANGRYFKPVSVIVPAFNEERTIATTVRSLLGLRYPEFEIIVVNDGSTDASLEELKKVLHLIKVERPLRQQLNHAWVRGTYVSAQFPQVWVLDKDNGGKADALNAGLELARFPLFCCIDADSVLEPDALLRVTKPFIDDREVVGAGGLVRVLNGCVVMDGRVTETRAPRSAIECIQAAEYTVGFLAGRTAWQSLNGLLIISGAFGVFRKDLVIAIGGYRHTVGEDMDLVVRLHRYCTDQRIRYKVSFVPEPVCWTQVPRDLRSLLRQRNRWHRGLIDSLWHSRDMFANPRYGGVGLAAFPYFVFVEALGPIIEFIGYFGFIVMYALGWIDQGFALLFFLIALLWGAWINAAGVMLDNLTFRRYRRLGDVLRMAVYGMVEFLGYRQLVAVERMIATFQFWKRHWGQARRHVIEQPERAA